MANKIEIDLTKIEELVSLGLTHEQIADSLGISQTALYSRKNLEILKEL